MAKSYDSIVLLVLVAIGGYLVYNYSTKKPTTATTPTSQPTTAVPVSSLIPVGDVNPVTANESAYSVNALLLGIFPPAGVASILGQNLTTGLYDQLTSWGL